MWVPYISELGSALKQCIKTEERKSTVWILKPFF